MICKDTLSACGLRSPCVKCVLWSQQVPAGSGPALSLERTPLLNVLHVVEGLALVVLCSCRPATRRLAVNVLKEVRALHTALGLAKVHTSTVDRLFNLALLLPFVFMVTLLYL